MRQTSEWVSLGHPDKMADYIACYLLDRYIERDPLVRFAVEVQIKDHFVTLAGEVSSTVHFSDRQLREFVRDAVYEIGYTAQYQRAWYSYNTICSADLKVAIHISQQSPDIGQGVDGGGWGDQGIFWGMAVRKTPTMMPLDYQIAKTLGRRLFAHRREYNVGLDIKTQVTLDGKKVRQVVVAAPYLGEEKMKNHWVLDPIRQWLGEYGKGAELIFNGTGRFTLHGPMGDAGVAGRKLAVDFYGGNCRIGGGSPWTKDPSKADLTLNLYARKLAMKKLGSCHADIVYCAISCCIGRPEIDVVFYNQRLVQIAAHREKRPPSEIIDELRLRQPTYTKRCREGLFFDIQ